MLIVRELLSLCAKYKAAFGIKKSSKYKKYLTSILGYFNSSKSTKEVNRVFFVHLINLTEFILFKICFKDCDYFVGIKIKLLVLNYK